MADGSLTVKNVDDLSDEERRKFGFPPRADASTGDILRNMTPATLPAKHDAPKYLLRIPPELNDRLWRLADEQNLSLNTTILLLLAGSVGFEFKDEP
jgi:HicB family